MRNASTTTLLVNALVAGAALRAAQCGACIPARYTDLPTAYGTTHEADRKR